MIKFDGNIVQFGFGAVGKSFFEKAAKEIKYNENKYFIITQYDYEFEAYINLGGMAANFITCEIGKDNFDSIFGQYLNSGDLLLDFADTVGIRDICDWCADNSIMYINTGAADWPENWLNIFEQDKLLRDVKEKHHQSELTNKHWRSKIVYKENIASGTEYVGVLLVGDNFEPVWVDYSNLQVKDFLRPRD